MIKFQSLGNLLKAFRSYHKLSQSDLSASLNVDIRSVIRWEKNETLLNNEKEQLLAEVTFIPYQVIRNLNSSKPIPTFYDFDLRKYSLSSLSNDLPNANWIKTKMGLTTERLRNIDNQSDLNPVIRHTQLQKNPLKSANKFLMWEASRLLPELNLILFDQSGYYSGHCVYFPISEATYHKIRSRTMTEKDLLPNHLVNPKTQKRPVFYCHSITADCNENFFYIIGAVLRYFNDAPFEDYIYALLTSRYDSHHMSDELGVETVWEDDDIKNAHGLLDAPRLVEGTFKTFLSKH